MSGINKAIIVGRLGKDPETKHLESGASVSSFSIATSEKWVDKNTGEQKEQTEWHNVVLWRGLAEVAEKYLHKGDMIYIEGKLRTRSWEKDGVTRYTTEIVGDNMTMLSSKSQSNKPPTPEEQYEKAVEQSNNSGKVSTGNAELDAETDDLPF